MDELQNILSRLVQTGTVTAVDSAKRRARVKFKDTGIISDWLYVLQHYGANFSRFFACAAGRRYNCLRDCLRHAPRA